MTRPPRAARVVLVVALVVSGCLSQAPPHETRPAVSSSAPATSHASTSREDELAGSSDAMDQFELAILRLLESAHSQ